MGGKIPQMESEFLVVSDAEFKELALQPGYEKSASGCSLTRVAVGVFWVIYRQSQWEKDHVMKAVVEAECDCQRRICKARLSNQTCIPENPDWLLGRREVWMLSNYPLPVTLDELESYTLAEERIAACRFKRRDLIQTAGERCNAWDGDVGCAEYLRAFDVTEREDPDGHFMRHGILTFADAEAAHSVILPKWTSVLTAMSPDEVSLFMDLGKEIIAAQQAQREIIRMADARWDDSHPEEQADEE
jgi:hypothetical protein